MSVSTDTWKHLIIAFFFWEFWCRAEDVIFLCYDNNTTLTWCQPVFWVQRRILFILTTVTTRAKANRWGLPSSPFLDEETPPWDTEQPARDPGLQVRARPTPPGTVASGSVGYTASLCAPLSLWTCEDFALLKKRFGNINYGLQICLDSL